MHGGGEKSDEAQQRWLMESMDRLSGGQFVKLADPLMDGRLREIIEQIKHKCKYSFASYARLSVRICLFVSAVCLSLSLSLICFFLSALED